MILVRPDTEQAGYHWRRYKSHCSRFELDSSLLEDKEEPSDRYTCDADIFDLYEQEERLED